VDPGPAPKDRARSRATSSPTGWRLYRHFFKTYSEKVWGVPADRISADWGGQRIKGMSLFRAVWEPLRSQVFGRRRSRGEQVTSLIEEFNYPKYGPGQMWEKAAEFVTAAGTKLEMESTVVGIHHRDGRAYAVSASTDGAVSRHECSHVISSMPMGALVRAMDPPPPPPVVAAADGLTYRDFMTVALVVPLEYSFPDNWIYIHDPEVRVGRIQNFGSWSPYLVKEGRTCLGLEFFVDEGDAMWNSPTPTSWPRPRTSSSGSGSATPPGSRPATWCGSPRRTPSTTSTTPGTSRCCVAGSTRTPPTSSRSAATACTGTTTRTTQCSPRC